MAQLSLVTRCIHPDTATDAAFELARRVAEDTYAVISKALPYRSSGEPPVSSGSLRILFTSEELEMRK